MLPVSWLTGDPFFSAAGCSTICLSFMMLRVVDAGDMFEGAEVTKFRECQPFV
jgi:hypothetical protein